MEHEIGVQGNVITPHAVVLVSGGLDSATALAVAIRDGFTPSTISFDYGQRHSIEVEAARRVTRHFGVKRHQVIAIDLRAFGGSALTSEMAVPKDRNEEDLSAGIPVTYVPARNTIFLSFALAYAEVIGARDIFIGVNALDYSGYPDCRPDFVSAFERLANVATKAGVEEGKFRIHAPLIELKKSEIIELGVSLGVDYSVTTSCYDPSSDGKACGHCDSCQLRLRGFTEAGLVDPIAYIEAVHA
jgi:7-cyano-7-deazaguanine synthase